MTDAEYKVWQVLRSRQLENMKFRRQFPIGNYIVDFICIEKKLVIEIDGGQHNAIRNKISDGLRTNYLESQRYTVLRFWNNEVFENLEEVVEKIRLTALNLTFSQREKE